MAEPFHAVTRRNKIPAAVTATLVHDRNFRTKCDNQGQTTAP